MNTVILKWNPTISSYSMRHYLSDLSVLIKGGDTDFNWSVWEHDKICAGDRYYMVKLGYGQTGIVSCGTITSNPYIDEDWSEQGREVYYVDFEPEVMINPDTLPILTSRELTNEIPYFDWNKGHSGVVLTVQQASALDVLWQAFIEQNKDAWTKAENARYKDQLYME